LVATQRKADSLQFAEPVTSSSEVAAFEDNTMMSDSNNQDNFHELYLQRNGEQYYYPIIYQHGMDQRECGLYYNVLKAQQNGGVFRQPRACYKPISGPPSVKSTPISILRNNKRPAKRSDDRVRPSLIRRFSFCDQLLEKEQHNTSPATIRRSRSSHIIDRPRVTFAEQVLVTTIHLIAEMPLEVRSNVWMSRDELLVCMHDAAIEQMQEQMAEEEEKRRNSLARQTSSTSVVDCNDAYASDSMVATFLM
jgi:hypothetical protein